VSIKCGYCKQRHPSVADVKACASAHHPSNAADTIVQPVATTGDASPKQLAFITSLAERKGVEAPQVHGRKEASQAIDNLLALADAPKPATEAKTEEAIKDEIGVYVMADGSLWQVKPNKAKTRTYAKVWVDINGERLTLAGTRVRGEWDYQPGMLATVLKEGRKMTLEEAKAFTLLYGQCARCGRRLKAAQSVEQGIGPVCIRYFGAFEAVGC
jgi:hypothetical protein